MKPKGKLVTLVDLGRTDLNKLWSTQVVHPILVSTLYQPYYVLTLNGKIHTSPRHVRPISSLTATTLHPYSHHEDREEYTQILIYF